MDVREVSEDSGERSAAVNTATGEAVREAVYQSRLTQAEVARRAGLSTRSVARKLAGQRTWTVPEIDAIARVLGVDPATLLRFPEVA